MATETQLMAVGPLDGRYAEKVEELSTITSEFGLIRYRVAVEAGWLATLGSGVLPDVNRLPDRAVQGLKGLRIGVEDALRVKNIESTTNHDVKAVELWLKEVLCEESDYEDYLELVHFGATSEDINNLAYALMLKEAREKVLIPQADLVIEDLMYKSARYSDIPMLARTHGQSASPTTLGKEMAVFEDRLEKHLKRLGGVSILGKFNGASGNFNALQFAYPDIDWPRVSQDFVESLGLDYNGTTTQIDPHDWMVNYFNEVAHGNNIMSDFATDMWTYISNGTFKQQVVSGEVGSSTMPHKINPIDFENAEGNFGAANAMLGWLADKLPKSRLQRDLSDSTAQRTIGEALGHTLLAEKSLLRGLGKVEADESKIKNDLKDEWSILTEAVQTVMRRFGVQGAYEIIKSVSRGKPLDRIDYLGMINGLNIPEAERQRLRDLTPETYIGLAPQIARSNLSQDSAD